VGQIIEKMRIRYPQSHHLRLIMRLKDLIDRDMGLLRRRHVEAIEKATTFWKARDGGYEGDELFRIAEGLASEQ
jgi:hypothetical protein